MINPSVHGWIDKFFTLQQPVPYAADDTLEAFYNRVRCTGFIFGHIVSLGDSSNIRTAGWLEEEVSKVALLNSLYQVHLLTTRRQNTPEFISKAVAFYDEMNPRGFNLLTKVLPSNTASANLEKIIDDRVRTNDNFVSKNFSHIVTNALLFIDVIAFRKFLLNDSLPEKYIKKTEELILSVVSLALKIKSSKTQYDTLLIKLFEASVRYSRFAEANVENPDSLQSDFFTDDLEKFYLIDMAGLALWSDGVIEKDEAYFLHKLAERMSVPDHFVNESILITNDFINKHRGNIPYFNYSNPIKHFYDRMTQSVVVLISRNKNRLIKEIRQNGHLMVLLAHSTHRDLDSKEKKKVRKQLLEICKTIPSLTIFLLPGGSLLLPILIKFIPKMLPSAFNENSESE